MLLFAVLAFCLAASPSVQTHSPLTGAQIASIDSFVTTEMARAHVPGVAVGIYSRGSILMAKGYGLANVELGVPVKPQTIFQSGVPIDMLPLDSTQIRLEEDRARGRLQPVLDGHGEPECRCKPHGDLRQIWEFDGHEGASRGVRGPPIDGFRAPLTAP